MILRYYRVKLYFLKLGFDVLACCLEHTSFWGHHWIFLHILIPKPILDFWGGHLRMGVQCTKPNILLWINPCLQSKLTAFDRKRKRGCSLKREQDMSIRTTRLIDDVYCAIWFWKDMKPIYFLNPHYWCRYKVDYVWQCDEKMIVNSNLDKVQYPCTKNNFLCLAGV